MAAITKNIQHKNIYKHYNHYEVVKVKNNKHYYFGSYSNLSDAMVARDYYKSLNWIKPEPTEEESMKNLQKQYYNRIYLSSNKRRYYINNIHGLYIGAVDTIEEALFLRDLYADERDKKKIPHVKDIDLTTNNPYIENGLAYELPERLIPAPQKNINDHGVIRKRGNHYRIEYSSKFFTSCITYEQAYFYKQELNKRGWDKKNLQGIEKDYPKWYTWLNHFYIYIIKQSNSNKNKWLINVTPNNNDGQTEHLAYSNIEDALFERDFLIKHNWDYNLLVETINDNNNPYYDMDLPPYPERKLNKIKERDYHEKELTEVYNLIVNEKIISQKEICTILNIGSVTFRNWLRIFWNTNWEEFKKISLSGENPINVLNKVPLIYTPNLKPVKPKHFKNYVQLSSKNKSNPYRIVKDGNYYGTYPTREIANKISNELQKNGWTQENRRLLQKKYGCGPKFKSRKYIYISRAGNYVVRHKNEEQKQINYGTYHSKLEAQLIRELLQYYGWNKEYLDCIKKKAKIYYNLIQCFKNNMFHGEGVEIVQC